MSINFEKKNQMYFLKCFVMVFELKYAFRGSNKQGTRIICFFLYIKRAVSRVLRALGI